MANRSKPQGAGPALQKSVGATPNTPPHLRQPSGTAANPFGGNSPHLQQQVDQSIANTPGVTEGK